MVSRAIEVYKYVTIRTSGPNRILRDGPLKTHSIKSVVALLNADPEMEGLRLLR
jgi:hypothetical protein